MSKMAFKKDENGSVTETVASIRRRISDAFGFKYSDIVLLEGNLSHYNAYNGLTYFYYSAVSFQVKGFEYFCNHIEDSRYLVMTHDRYMDI